MARPRKDGLDYFPLDIHFNEKIKALEFLHKNEGLVWIIKFWQTAYSKNSGEVNLNGVFGVSRAENCRITTGKQTEIIRDCLEIGLITQLKDGIYTSNGIQKRLSQIVKDRESDRKRKLVGGFPTENYRNTEVFRNIPAESKGKESKGKESKVKKEHKDEPSGSKSEPPAEVLKNRGLKRAYEMFCVKYESVTDKPYIKQWGKDYKLLKSVMGSINSPDHWTVILDEYFQDQWAADKGFSFGLLISQINKYNKIGVA